MIFIIGGIVRKVVLIVISILILGLSIFSYYNYQKNDNLEKDNDSITKKIDKISKEINKTKTDTDGIDKEIADLSSKISGDINEYNVWIEMKEKLEQSLLD